MSPLLASFTMHYALSQLKKYGDPPMVVIRRDLDTGISVLPVGARYSLDLENKRDVMRRNQYYDARRIDIDPEWLREHVPGAARFLPPVSQPSQTSKSTTKKGKVTDGLRSS